MRKWFYVLELADGHFYVGMSSNFVQRWRQHTEGQGAVWTSLHPPVGVLFQRGHEVADLRAAELIENEITVRLMLEHGWRRVRGGFFCGTTEEQVQHELRAHGHWDRVLQASVAPAAAPLDWTQALERVIKLAVAFHDGGCDAQARDALVAQLVGLRDHRHWSSDFEPGLEEQFWGVRGVMRVLLTMHLNRVVGFKLQDPFAVLHSGMQMGRQGARPWNHLFLAAWDAYRPTATASQQERVDGCLADANVHTPDRRFDAFVAVLFPRMRWRLRSVEE